MAHHHAVAAFLTAILPLVATPGASLALLMRQVTERGRGRALPVVLGTATGLYVHAVLAAAGLSALVMHSDQAFRSVRLGGAVFLIGLGVWTWCSAGRRPPETLSRSRVRRRLPGFTGSAYAQALAANVLNPKAASVYLTLVPQFVAPERALTGQILVLATAHAVLMTLWLLFWSLLAGRAARALRTPRVKDCLTRVTALVLLGLGLRSAVA
ncbi:LysE family translocator [Streptomyces meridianus]|uniref:LysE family translocator n=1 Tax=Streptomyces meridianus TaxID=2938945 RepID=A0ABT0X221_9ACTN|nr:LysE family translocator [Streptomyces meridianus]MCM2576591.1 LysE family translocator [Streptomyces meridianus]